MTHFFGFAGNVEAVQDLCRIKNVYLLEDCAHAFTSCLGERSLGTWGDLCIFSYKKSLPIPDGGCLVVNNPEIPCVQPSNQPPSMAVNRKAVKLLFDHFFIMMERKSKLIYNALQKFKESLLSWEAKAGKFAGANSMLTYNPELDSFDYDSHILDFGMSRLSLAMLSKIDAEQIKMKRRANYSYMLDALKDLHRLRPLYGVLPAGTCPLKFPLLVSTEHPQAQSVIREFPYIRWWWSLFHPSVPWERFPESLWLKKNCYIIEIHQDMERYHLDYLIDCVRKVDKALTA